MSDSPAPSTFEHRVHTVTSLLAALVCLRRELNLVTEEELSTILTETIREASEDILQRVKLGVPVSDRLSTMLDIHLAEARARQGPFDRLGYTWLWVLIALPIILFCIFLCQLWDLVMWEIRLFVRWWRCLRAHLQQVLQISLAIRAQIRHELPDLTDRETDWMSLGISVLALVEDLLKVCGRD